MTNLVSIQQWMSRNRQTVPLQLPSALAWSRASSLRSFRCFARWVLACCDGALVRPAGSNTLRFRFASLLLTYTYSTILLVGLTSERRQDLKRNKRTEREREKERQSARDCVLGDYLASCCVRIHSQFCSGARVRGDGFIAQSITQLD